MRQIQQQFLILAFVLIGLTAVAACGDEDESTGATSAAAAGEGEGEGEGQAQLKGLGENCTQGVECEGGNCILSQGDSGFCTRACTSENDCPEQGWVCNISPYTACVPE